MNKFIFLTLAILSLQLKAMESGTFSTLIGTSNGVQNVEQTFKVLSYDETSGYGNVEIKTNVPGHSNDQMTRYMKVDSCKIGENAVQQCTQLGGNVEVINVPAGSFKTCKIVYQNSSSCWWGPVPFGCVKWTGGDGIYQPISAMELKSYTPCAKDNL